MLGSVRGVKPNPLVDPAHPCSSWMIARLVWIVDVRTAACSESAFVRNLQISAAGGEASRPPPSSATMARERTRPAATDLGQE
jgi:hypothetical protein